MSSTVDESTVDESKVEIKVEEVKVVAIPLSGARGFTPLNIHALDKAYRASEGFATQLDLGGGEFCSAECRPPATTRPRGDRPFHLWPDHVVTGGLYGCNHGRSGVAPPECIHCTKPALNMSWYQVRIAPYLKHGWWIASILIPEPDDKRSMFDEGLLSIGSKCDREVRICGVLKSDMVDRRDSLGHGNDHRELTICFNPTSAGRYRVEWTFDQGRLKFAGEVNVPETGVGHGQLRDYLQWQLVGPMDSSSTDCSTPSSSSSLESI